MDGYTIRDNISILGEIAISFKQVASIYNIILAGGWYLFYTWELHMVL